MAIACSTRDPRFHPVTSDEFPKLDLEISVLTTLEEICDFEKICIGQHGLMIKKGLCSGLLLPQVAAEYGWDRQKFMRETCRKAGLHADAWMEPEATVLIFSAQVFGRSLV
jgi:AmmeMemoRadiSam system protein A